jgi:hypothetical protein
VCCLCCHHLVYQFGVVPLFGRKVALDVPPELNAVQQYSRRQYHTKGKDVQYAALQVSFPFTYNVN